MAPWRVLLLGAAALLLLLILLFGLLVAFVESDAFEAQVKERVLPMVSERIEREVTVETVDAQILPRPAIRLGGLQVAGRSELPIFRSEEVQARLRVWPLLTSRGRHLVLESLQFQDTTARLIRLPGGEWDLPQPPPSKRQTTVDLEDVSLDNGSFQIVRGEELSMEITDLQASTSFRQGLLSFRDLSGVLFGSTINGGGTHIDFSKDPIPWVLEAGIEGLDLASLPQRGETLRGGLGADLDLLGAGIQPGALARSTTGEGTLRATDLLWRSFDLERAVAAELTGLLRAAGVRFGEVEVDEEGTYFGDWEAPFRVQEGWVSFTEPIPVDSPAGETSFTGRMRLDSTLDLRGETRLNPDFVSMLSQGELVPDAPVPITYAIHGNLSRPRIEEIDPSAFLPLLAGEARERIERGLRKMIPPFGATPAPQRTPR